MTTTTTTTEIKKTPQTFTGVVVSDKMKDSIVVAVKRFVKHAKYDKFQSKTTKLMAHDAGNTKKIGDKVTIVGCRPMSKRKAFMVVK